MFQLTVTWRNQFGERSSHRQLICVLKRAYSGELAAAYAYRGHWKSLKNPLERDKVQEIENEEWIHRETVGSLLDELEYRPAKAREALMWIIGRTVGILCHLTGRFLPAYFAGRLEGRNAEEYESAALCAGQLGLTHFESELRMMAGVEKEHEIFFMNMVANHRLFPLVERIFSWGKTPT